MEVSIFYAWQVDSSTKTNKFLIRDAAVAACQRITDDNDNPWVLKLDSDTQGVAGMCDIPNEILNKIDNCDLLLCDLSLIGTSIDGKKRLPNSNVVFELGYAVGRNGFEAVISVVNEANGKIEEQIFDIKRRAAVKYDSSDLIVAKRVLVKTLEEVFRLSIEEVVVPKRSQQTQDKSSEFLRTQHTISQRVLNHKFHEFVETPAVVITMKSSQPIKSESENFHTLQLEGLKPWMSDDAIAWKERVDSSRIIELDGSRYLFHTSGDSYQTFQAGMNPYQTTETDIIHHLSSKSLQMSIVKDAFELLILFERMGATCPVEMGVSLVGFKNYRLIVGNHFPTNPFSSNEVHLKPVSITKFDPTKQDFPVTLRPILDQLCRQVGESRSSCYANDGAWNLGMFGY